MPALPAIDYLIIGHVTLDVFPHGNRLGGTATYAGLTAERLGHRVGLVTRCNPELDCTPLESITGLMRRPSQITTQFENRYINGQRQQSSPQVSEPIALDDIPIQWHNANIIHLAPVLDEVNPRLVRSLSGDFIGLTPQGWLRQRDANGAVHLSHWQRVKPVLPDADAVVLSLEDLGGDINQASEMARFCRLLVVTLGADGAMVYWCGEQRILAAPVVAEIDPTGAGDIFAAAFFSRVAGGEKPWQAAEFANRLAADSVQRAGLESIPSPSQMGPQQKRKGA